MSSTVFVSGPAWSSDEANAIIPNLLTLPYVGFIPTTPQKAAGWRIDPPVSVPIEPRQRDADVATAEPPLDPPGTLSVSQGFFVGPKYEVSVEEPIANSSILFLPVITAPASRSFFVTVAS